MLPKPPSGFESGFIQLSCGRVRLVQGGSGEPVVMVHGLGGSAEDFFAVAPLLAQSHKVFICDLPGFGQSDKPDAPYTAPWFDKVLADLAQKLGLASPAWVGHSMGGMLVLRLAAMRPDMVSRVAGICPAGGQPGTAFFYRLASLLLANRNDRLRFYHPRLMRLSFALMFDDPDMPRARELLARVERQWAANRRELEIPLVRSGRGIISSPLWPLARRITCPRLVVSAERDRVIPGAHTRRLLRNMSKDCNHITMNCGHMPVYSMPEKLAGHLNLFLNGRSLT